MPTFGQVYTLLQSKGPVESCPAERPGTESKPGMAISWGSPEVDELQYIQTVGAKLSLAKGVVPAESTTVPTAFMTGIEITS